MSYGVSSFCLGSAPNLFVIYNFDSQHDVEMFITLTVNQLTRSSPFFDKRDVFL